MNFRCCRRRLIQGGCFWCRVGADVGGGGGWDGLAAGSWGWRRSRLELVTSGLAGGVGSGVAGCGGGDGGGGGVCRVVSCCGARAGAAVQAKAVAGAFEAARAAMGGSGGGGG